MLYFQYPGNQTEKMIKELMRAGFPIVRLSMRNAELFSVLAIYTCLFRIRHSAIRIRPVPCDVAEANASQSVKTYRQQKMLAAALSPSALKKSVGAFSIRYSTHHITGWQRSATVLPILLQPLVISLLFPGQVSVLIFQKKPIYIFPKSVPDFY